MALFCSQPAGIHRIYAITNTPCSNPRADGLRTYMKSTSWMTGAPLRSSLKELTKRSKASSVSWISSTSE